MRFTLSWLKEFLDTSASLDEIVEALNKIGLMVESVANPAKDLKDFIIVEVLSAKPHPNADRLQVCEISTGSEKLQVVCGDPKARAGMKAVLARPGMMVPGLGIVLKQAKIRDVESFGMLCSLTELGLTTEPQKGILDLDPSAPVGKAYVDYAGLDDPIIELELTPNRSDCLGVYGVARDLAAAGIGNLKPLHAKPVKGAFASPIQVKLDFPAADKAACPYFTGRVIRNVKNGESPKWLQDRLKAIGLRPISALVDVTNFMAYHINRPMHVFDADKLRGNLTIRLAKSGETLKALDDIEYDELSPFMTVIADDKSVCSLAGIMGGFDSGCTNETTNVFLESAYFEAVRTARSGRTLGIISDSRYRFERGVDPDLVIDGLELATQMILEICGGEASEVVIAGANPKVERKISFNPNLVKTLGAVDVPQREMFKILSQLGFVMEDHKDHLDVIVPSWRHDVEGPADLVEEIIRIVGFDNIELADLPSPQPAEAYESFSGAHQQSHRQNIARRALAARGLTECQTWSFISRKQAALFGGVDDAMVITNPISLELEVMRASLLPNLLAGVSRNSDRSIENSALFEVGNQYRSDLPMNQQMVVAGVRSGSHTPRHWLTKTREVDVYDAKSDLFNLLEVFGLDVSKVQVVTEGLPAWYHPGKSARVQLGPKLILGYFGEIHPHILKQFDIDETVVAFELLLANVPLLKEENRKTPIKISTLQPLTRDLAFILDAGTPIADVLKSMRQVNQDLIKGIDVFDVYQGEGISQGKKSVAFTLHIVPYERTLTDKEINDLIDQAIAKVKTNNGGELRV
jgi:phenylalanyl-tRNA synthetase beta chain